MRHFPDTDTIEFDSPRIVTLAPERPEVRVSALRGTGPDDGSAVELIGDVRIVRTGESAGQATNQTRDPTSTRPAQPLIATTARATVQLETRVVTTDEAVEIEIGEDRLAGTGMRLDSDARRLEILSAVRGSLAPRP